MGLWNFFERKDPQNLFLDFSPQGSHWRVVSWNFELENPSDRQWIVEVHHTAPESIQWEKKKHEELKFFKNSLLQKKLRVSENRETLKNLMNLAIHSTLKYGLESQRDFMLEPVPGATAIDIQNEGKALLWIQATFETLTRVLDNFSNRSDLILTASFFSGTVPETQEKVIRLIAFNLDIFYYLRPDSTLLIVVFDDKDKGHGNSKAPSFQQIIKVTKPQFYDEIVKLLQKLALVGEIS